MGITDTAAAFSFRDSLFARAESSKLPGGAQKDQGIGIVSFLTAVSSGSAIFAFQLLLFLLLRNKLARIFKPKTYLVPRCEQTDSPNGGLIQLLRGLWNVSDQEVIRKCGLDAYLFLRYLKTLLVIFIPIAGVVIPVLVPLNYVDGRGRQLNSDGQSNTHLDLAPVTGLDTLAWGNVKASNTNRYWAHLAMSVLVVAWVCFVFFLEMRVYIKVRQDHLTSADHRLKPSTTTILVSSIPEKWRTEEALKDLFRMFPDGVKKVWVNRDLSSLLRKIAHRDAVHRRLEAAETDLIKSVHKAQYKRGKTAETGPRKNPGLDTMSRQDQTSCDGQNGQKSQRQMARMKKADGSEPNGVYLQSHPGAACFVRGIHRAAAQEGSAKIASNARCSNGVSIPNQEIKNSKHVAIEETHLAEISQAVRAASRAGIRMEKMAARTNGFSPLAQAYVNDCSEEHSWIEQDQSVLNTSQNSMIENPEKEPGPSRVSYVAKWWQFWKPPYGSSATPY
ncbi:hypothetical protein CEP52_017296 [Fusarium oligoseptatum]|uniref:CSC1/OSCA1-like N-terminal transmembrane domain-containing protein n=1 Tax=Fusarium oligoseptatum TaxID=2604345 RepID=A0A428RTN5_9HYPO|nr:hypothetical protein CEP52_017296 [Fusarium oligoseptatum]